MLQLIPDTIPKKAPRAEKKFFQLTKNCSEELSKWTVFWSTRINIHQDKEDGECDFIFLGPPGLFVIEVKGGDYYERVNGISRWGNLNSKRPLLEKEESPLDQAKGNMYSIREFLNRRIKPKNLNIKQSVLFTYAAAHPYADLSNLKEDLEFNPKQIHHAKSNTSIFKFLLQLEKYKKEEKAKRTYKKLSQNEIKLISRHLKSNFKCINHGADSELSREEILILEGEQRTLIDSIDIQNKESRVLVEGNAGTGKTVVAKMIAEDYSLLGKKVLWISFNRLITKQIKNFFSKNGLIDVLTSTDLMVKSIKNAGIEFNSQITTVFKLSDQPLDLTRLESSEIDLVSKFRESLLGNTHKKYDVLIIDEAQDILSLEFVNCLGSLLEGGLESGSWAIFYDKEFQSKVYGVFEENALSKLENYSTNIFKLNKNRRNAREIVNFVSEKINTPVPKSLRETKGKVRIKDCTKLSSPDSPFRIEQQLVDIFNAEENPVVLSKMNENNFLREIVDNNYLASLVSNKKSYFLKGLSGRKKSDNDLIKNPKVNLDYFPIDLASIHAFKGLERNCVIVHWSKREFENSRNLQKYIFYTALTRAFNSVYIVLTDKSNEFRSFKS